jgi:hypothetical protein
MSPSKEHLVLADDQFEVAKMLAASADPRLRLLLTRAKSDIDLALGLAREAAARPHTFGMNDRPFPIAKMKANVSEVSVLPATCPVVLAAITGSCAAGSVPGTLIEARRSLVAVGAGLADALA